MVAERSYETHYTPWRDTQGELLGCIGVAIDITGHKRAQAELVRHREHLEELVQARTDALSQQHRRNEMILATTQDGFAVTNTDGTFSYFVNQ